MNNKITAIKKKIELKDVQLRSKEELAVRCKEAVKEIKHELELLKNELAKEEMQEMMGLMEEKRLEMDDVKAAIVSGIIVRKQDISDDIKEINKNEDTSKEECDDTDIG